MKKRGPQYKVLHKSGLTPQITRALTQLNRGSAKQHSIYSYNLSLQCLRGSVYPNLMKKYKPKQK